MSGETNAGALRDKLPLTTRELGSEEYRCKKPGCDCTEVAFSLKCRCVPEVIYDRAECVLMIFCAKHRHMMKVKVADR